MDPSTPESVGPYRLEKRLGKGGMGEVFRGYDERLDRAVALKRVKPERDDPESFKRFRREAKAAAQLSHAAVVQVHDWIENDSGAWIVMELVDGQSLRTVMGRPMPLDQVLKIGAELAAGLGAAHRAGLVHRDFKPDNVMLPVGGGAKILDFGLAKRSADTNQTVEETSLTGDNKIIGTLSAMSPEQALGRPVDARSDLFALGLVLYEMLTGASPFRSSSTVETLTRICTLVQPPVSEKRPDVPQELSDLIDHLLEKDPTQRPRSTEQVMTALAGLDRREVSNEITQVQLPAGNEIGSVETAEETDPSRPIPTETSYQSPPRWRRLPVLVLALFLLGSASWWLASRVAPADETALTKARRALGPHELYGQGRSLLRVAEHQEQLDEAAELFEQILAANPKSAPAYAGLADTRRLRYEDQNRDAALLVQARGAADRALELDPYLADARVARAAVAEIEGRLEDARQDLEAALRLEPSHAGAFYIQGRALEASSRPQDAETSYLRAVELDPGDRRIRDDLGALLLRAGRYDDAEAQFLESRRLAPNSIHGPKNLAAVFYMQGRYSDAASQIQDALKIKASPALYSNLGALLFIQGLYQEAESAFERALEISNAANDYLFWANLADAQRWGSEPEKAHESYRRAIQLLKKESEPRSGDVTLSSRLALYTSKSGDLKQAARILDDLHGSSAQLDSSSLYRLAVTAELCGRREAAVTLLGRALQAGYSRHEVELDPELTRLRTDRAYHRLFIDTQADGAPP